jgi:hypothetical protein
MYSESVSDPKVTRAVQWVLEHGGIVNVEVRKDKDGVRGLYSSIDLDTDEVPLIQIPNKLIISPLHIQSMHCGQTTYSDVFALCPELFDAKYPYEANH